MTGTLDTYVRLLDTRDAARDELVSAIDHGTDAEIRRARRAYNAAMRALTAWKYEREV